MPNVLISENWPDLLLPGFRKIFVDVFKQLPSQLDQVFNIQDSDMATEKLSQVGAFPGVSEFTGKIEYSESPVQGYDKSISHTEYAGGYIVERKLAADDLYRIVAGFPKSFATSVKRQRETLGWDVFNNAFTLAPSDGDAVSLCSSSHPSPADASYALDNSGTSVLSATSVSATRLYMRKFTDDTGGKIYIMGDTLIVPLDLEEKAWEIVTSRGQLDSANNNPNFSQGKYKVIVAPFLSSAKNWFMVDSAMIKDHLFWFNREPVQYFKDSDSDTLQAKYAVYFRCSTAWQDPRFLYGHVVS